MEGIGGLHGWQWIVRIRYFHYTILQSIDIVVNQFCLEGLGGFMLRVFALSLTNDQRQLL